MSENMSRNRPFDAASEGISARSKGHRRDACPYPAGSPERDDWLQGFDGESTDRRLQGFDGESTDRPPDLPLDQTG